MGSGFFSTLLTTVPSATTSSPATVLGVDAYPSGWCAVPIRIDVDACRAGPPAVFPDFAAVLASAAAAAVICVDMPIGLADGPRECDRLARRLLGFPRASSVFSPPCRDALRLIDYRAASDANLQATGKRLTRQAFGIARRIAEVDACLSPDLQTRVLEAHPELAFRALNGGVPLASSKHRPAGRLERWRLLRTILPDLPPDPPAGPCPPADLMDALAVAWTAVCVHRGGAIRVPADPPRDARGLRMEIWAPAERLR